jgi:hypothetical protein
MPINPGTSAPGPGGEGPALLAFFKTGCPTCQLSFPVWGELSRRYGDAVDVVAVSQDPQSAARPWLDERGFDGPLHDDSAGFPLSRAFEVDVVPTLVLVGEHGVVLDVEEGWSRDAANAWDERLAELTGRASPGPLSTPEDGLPPYKPG